MFEKSGQVSKEPPNTVDLAVIKNPIRGFKMMAEELHVFGHELLSTVWSKIHLDIPGHCPPHPGRSRALLER